VAGCPVLLFEGRVRQRDLTPRSGAETLLEFGLEASL
jgi:hypothetical protein